MGQKNGKEESFPKRGEIYWTNFDPTIGAETKKTRPGLIISNDIGNEVSRLVIIAPITSKLNKVYPYEAKIFINNKERKIMINQCRAIDKSRLIKKIIDADQQTMKQVDEAIKIVFNIS